MRSDRPDSPRRGDERRMVSKFPRLERLESRDLMALVVGSITPVDNVLFSGKVATFAAGDVSGTLSDFTAMINWGDATTTTTPNSVSIAPDPAPGYFDVIASKTYAKPGAYPLVVTVAGTGNTSITAQGTANVLGSPLTVSPSSFAVTQNTLFTDTVATFTADPTTSPGDFTASIDWGGGAGPKTSGTIVPTGQAGKFLVQGTYQYPDVGQHSIIVMVQQDNSSAPETVTSSAFVSPSLTVTGLPIVGTSGVAITAPVATFIDGGGSTSPSNFSATINWGSGLPTTSATITALANSPGHFAVAGNYTYANSGSYTVTVNVVNLTTSLARSSTSTATVSSANIPTLTASGTQFTPIAAQQFKGVVASFHDASAAGIGPFMATINWGPGLVTTIGVVAPVTGMPGYYTVSGNYTYAMPGTATATVNIVSSTGQSVMATSTATVVPSSLTSTGTMISPTANVKFSGTVASFVDIDSSTNPASYSAAVNWGTGLPTTSGTVVAVQGSPGHFNVIGTFTYSTPGTEPVSVSITNSATSQSTTASTTAVVSPSLTANGSNLTPSVNVPFTAVVASFFDSGLSTNPNEFTAMINWGGAQSMTVGIVSPVQGSPGHFDVTGSYKYSSPGPFTVTVTIARADTNQNASASTGVFVSPSLSLIGTPILTATAGVPFSGQVATFIDGGGSTTPGDFTAKINWGTGVATPATITYSGTAGTFAVNGSFIYPSSGEFSPTITVTRNATSQSVSASTTAIVGTSLVGSGNPITTTAGESFSGQVATFTDSTSTTPNPGNYAASIDWHDGHVSTGTITYNTATKAFEVFGMNTYALANTYPITVTLARFAGNQVLTISSSAVVYNFTGGLDPLINTGSPTGIGITNHNQPTLAGTAEPNALVRLFGQKTDGSPSIPLGETVAGSNGLWKMTLLPLADGTYTIVGVSVPTTGSPYPPVLLTTFLVDTVAPRVVGLNYDTSSGKVTVTFRDDRSGINPVSLFNRNNYTLLGPGNTVTPASSVQAGPTVATLPDDPESVVLTFHLNPKNRGGSHRLRIVSGGVTDLAGNSLVGGVFGPISTSKGHPAPSHPAKSAASHPTGKSNHRH